jgi:ABC-type transport system involved in multi-copper enzyme maturation permease subunit
MYLWKCWRDTRLSFLIYLTISVAATVLWLFGTSSRARPIAIEAWPTENLWFLFVIGAMVFGAIFAGAIGITLGSRNIGTDLATGSAEFLLTRPRSRRYLVWASWGVGIAEILALIGITALVALAALYFQGGSVWRDISVVASAMPQDRSSAMRSDLPRLLLAAVRVPLLVASIVLTTAVLYGLTYLLTVLTRSGQRAIAYSLAIVLVYSMVGSASTRWMGISLPTLAFYLVDSHAQQPWHFSPTVQLALWSICAIAFPLAAQFMLDKAEM